MSDKFDEALREALTAEEREAWDKLVEPSPLQLALELFRKRTWYLHAMSMVVGVVLLGVGGYALTYVVAADDPVTALRWSLGFIMCMWGLWAVKVWAWMEMQRNALTREVKRVELQVLHLGAEVRKLTRGGAAQ
jgi:hypothetical protein